MSLERLCWILGPAWDSNKNAHIQFHFDLFGIFNRKWVPKPSPLAHFGAVPLWPFTGISLGVGLDPFGDQFWMPLDGFWCPSGVNFRWFRRLLGLTFCDNKVWFRNSLLFVFELFPHRLMSRFSSCHGLVCGSDDSVTLMSCLMDLCIMCIFRFM